MVTSARKSMGRDGPPRQIGGFTGRRSCGNLQIKANFLARRLDTYITGTGFEITPVVGLVRVPFPVRLDAFEVAELFEVPLAFIIDPANHERRSRELRGSPRSFYVLPYQDRYIWGATAAMLVNLAEVLAA